MSERYRIIKNTVLWECLTCGSVVKSMELHDLAHQIAPIETKKDGLTS
jgi:hypothetical protein